MIKVFKYALSSFFLIIFLSVTSCDLTQQEKDPYEGMTAEELFTLASKTLNAKKYEQAIELFEKLYDIFPYTEFAKQAILQKSIAYSLAKDYDNSRKSAQRFIYLYPVGESAAYAQYLIASSYYDELSSVGADQGVVLKALDSLRELIENYPLSEYTKSAQLKFDLAFNVLAENEMEIGRYYLKKNNYIAAINRFRVVVEDFQTTTQTPEALARLVEAYLSLGLINEAQTAAAILGHNYQSSQFYKDSYDLLKKRGLKPEEKGQSWLGMLYQKIIKNK
jgi:outer membrane protein assembly factor BamD